MLLSNSDLRNDIQIEFLYSSSLELVCSFHVICDPSHHQNCVDWYDKVIETVDPALIERIIDFGRKFVNWSYVMDIIDYLL